MMPKEGRGGIAHRGTEKDKPRRKGTSIEDCVILGGQRCDRNDGEERRLEKPINITGIKPL
jgi:hypothetical protein